ncbi:hypothetical protein ACO0LO_05020 [Undibacterium sp. TJN25]|uniref:hypothetical protein n=1 Tax=Undibacterium sp. TJN25 TaxID=3413056 RepID=UPI003BF06282
MGKQNVTGPLVDLPRVISHTLPEASVHAEPTEYEKQPNEDDLSRVTGKPSDDEGQAQAAATGKPA